MKSLLVVAALCASSHAARLHERSSARMHRGVPPASPGAKPTLLRLRGGGAAPTSPAATNLVSKIADQLAYEVAHCTVSKAKFFGFCGACCNWFLGLSAVNDALHNGPEVISLQMTLAMLAYSLLFSRWAGWDVSPANFMLAGSHMFNVAAQLNQLRRVVAYKLDKEAGGKAEISALATKSVGAVVIIATYALMAPKLKVMMPQGSYLASAAGPFTIHPWPPVTKLFLSAASLTDLHRPTDKISLPQYAALTLTGQGCPPTPAAPCGSSTRSPLQPPGPRPGSRLTSPVDPPRSPVQPLAPAPCPAAPGSRTLPYSPQLSRHLPYRPLTQASSSLSTACTSPPSTTPSPRSTSCSAAARRGTSAARSRPTSCSGAIANSLCLAVGLSARAVGL